MAMFLLSSLVLTACSLFQPAQPTVVLSDSVTMRILPGDLPKSPAAKGWFLGDTAMAKLLEKAESCNSTK